MGSRYSDSGLGNYIKKINKYPLLSAEEEFDLARSYKAGDLDAGHRIIISNLRFVVRQGRPYFCMGYGPLEIVQEGNLGLVKALSRFDPERQVKFIYYAAWWVRAYISNFVYNSYHPQKGRLTHSKYLVSLDAALSSDGGNETTLMDRLSCSRADQESFYAGKERHSCLMSILDSDPPILSQREVFIIKQRFFNDPPSTLRDISLVIGVTRERVRQIEFTSLKRLRVVLEKKKTLLAEDISLRSSYPSG